MYIEKNTSFASHDFFSGNDIAFQRKTFHFGNETRFRFQGRYFFIIFINDIVIDIQSTIKLFADDTSLYLIIDNPQTTADILNRDLDKIHTWSTNWLVSFNPQKTETMTISRKITKLHHPDIFMNDTPIAEVPNHKYIGLHISKDGTHHTHID